MVPPDWHEVKAIFQKAIDLPQAERLAFVEQTCKASTRDKVIRLLEKHSEETDFLESPLADRSSSETNRPSGNDNHQLLGQCVDDFKLAERIGSGGMGTVFVAHQKNPDRQVAIKILNIGNLEGSVARRFRDEAEILGRLRHPGIAHVYAAGNHDFGYGPQPWFALEYVHGKSLHEFANRFDLGKLGWLKLLLQICDAVQHAHDHGVIHRDLKPANILMVEEPGTPGTSGDSEQTDSASESFGDKVPCEVPTIKIVDFGVARVMDADQQRTLLTSGGEILGTLKYMSPEQVKGDPDAVDQRTDVFALGLIGFELLTGKMPFDRLSDSMTETIKNIEWSRPKRLGQFKNSLRDDLELIFEKALANDLSVRYPSVNAFANDLRRYLSREPVTARPPSVLYRARKFISRHRALVGGTVATITALVVGLVLALSQAHQARLAAEKSRYEEEKATAINDFVVNDFMTKFLSAANENRSGEEQLDIVPLVDHAVSKIGEMFGGRPTIEAAVRNQVATIYYNAGAFDQASEQYNVALQLWQNELGAEHPDTLKAVNNVGLCDWQLRRYDQAEKLFRRALAGRLKVLGERDPLTLVSMNNLALLLQSQGEFEEPQQLFERALELQLEVHGQDHKDTISTMINLGRLKQRQGDLKEATRLQTDAYESSCRLLGEHHATSLIAGLRLAHTLLAAMSYEKATTVIESVIEGNHKLNGPVHFSTMTARRLSVRILAASGHRKEALSELDLMESELLALKVPDQRQLELVRRERKSIHSTNE